MKHNKSNTAFLLEIVIIFSPICLSEAAYVISTFSLMKVLKELIANQIIVAGIIDHHRKKQYT